jgi:hypothetical protein
MSKTVRVIKKAGGHPVFRSKYLPLYAQRRLYERLSHSEARRRGTRLLGTRLLCRLGTVS